MAIPDDDGELLRLVADVLYDVGEAGAQPWPTTAELDQLRARLGALADDLTTVGRQAEIGQEGHHPPGTQRTH